MNLLCLVFHIRKGCVPYVCSLPFPVDTGLPDLSRLNIVQLPSLSKNFEFLWPRPNRTCDGRVNVSSRYFSVMMSDPFVESKTTSLFSKSVMAKLKFPSLVCWNPSISICDITSGFFCPMNPESFVKSHFFSSSRSRNTVLASFVPSIETSAKTLCVNLLLSASQILPTEVLTHFLSPLFAFSILLSSSKESLFDWVFWLATLNILIGSPFSSGRILPSEDLSRTTNATATAIAMMRTRTIANVIHRFLLQNGFLCFISRMGK
mmetsp:Transcript_33871/g.39084  ORF Transcript_33871/g.39084 Transcript_33871/m.39084 type:complete len:263 (-) Transcript_33871:83-871(-)